jgi:DNA replication and repair protein RecF
MSRINHLQLKGFRCWEALDWAPGGDVHLLVGDNGVGKTSILEAIFICLSLRPAHGVRWRELIPQGADHGFVGAELEGASGLQDVRIGFDRFDRRLRVDDQAPRSASAFAAGHSVVFFRPGDLSLVQGGPKGRRRLLDTIAEQIFADHRQVQSRYAQALGARNALLLPRARGGELLDIWSQEAARYGAVLIAHRAAASQALAADLAPAYESICGGREKLVARYRPCVSTDDTVNALLELWRSNEARDRRQGYTSQGPHSEDWELKLDGRNLRQRASQGQQRSAVLACRLAQVELTARRSRPPILLLDDITGELDDKRAEQLFGRLLERAGQVFVTATRDPSPWLRGERELTRFSVSSQRIDPIRAL